MFILDSVSSDDILKLTTEIEKYQFMKNSDNLDDKIIDHLLNLSLVLQNVPRPDILYSLPREKKILMIKQVNSQQSITNSKGPKYYVDLICEATCSQLTGSKTRTEQIVDIISRSITGLKPAQPLKDIIVELKIQCQCQSLSY
jgi:hypothetical protein